MELHNKENELTPIELQRLGNDVKKKHDLLKAEILSLTDQIEELEIVLNNKAKELQELEKTYVDIVEKLIN